MCYQKIRIVTFRCCEAVYNAGAADVVKYHLRDPTLPDRSQSLSLSLSRSLCLCELPEGFKLKCWCFRWKEVKRVPYLTYACQSGGSRVGGDTAEG